MTAYYVDTCIWLNLLKKEERFGVKYWEIAEDFLEKHKEKIVISTAVTKELSRTLGDDYWKAKNFICLYRIPVVKPSFQEYKEAKIIQEEHPLLSFSDCLHIVIARNMQALLITRDKALIRKGRNYLPVARPEEVNQQSIPTS